MTKAKDLAALLDNNGDVVSSALDNVPAADLVNDTSPQLGGDLQSNGNDIVFADNDKAIFGANTDLEIYSDATSSYVHSKKAGGYLRLKSEGGIVLQAGNSENVLFAAQNGKTALYFDAAEKLETTSTGVAVTGTLAATAITGDGSGLTNLPSAGIANVVYAANESSPTAQPSATGANAIAIGDGADSSGNSSIAIGFNSESTGSQNVALGAGKATGTLGSLSLGGFGSGYSQASDSWAVAIGRSLASGNTSLAMNITNNTSSYGATGANSIAIGYQAKATSADSFAIGDRAVASGATSLALNSRSTASGSNSIAMGLLSDATGSGSIAIGNGYSFNGAQATFYNAIAIGQGSLSNKIGKVAISGSAFSASGDSQHGIFVLRVATTNNTATTLITGTDTLSSATPDADNQIILPNNSAFSFHGTIVARESAASGTDCAAWKVEGLIRREGSAGTTVLVNSATTVLDNTPSWGMALSADTTNGGLKIEVTGAASTNIRWVATIHTSEVTYA